MCTLYPSPTAEIKLNWVGTVNGEEAKGKVVLPYVSDENADEEPEVGLGLQVLCLAFPEVLMSWCQSDKCTSVSLPCVSARTHTCASTHKRIYIVVLHKRAAVQCSAHICTQHIFTCYVHVHVCIL